MLKSAKRSQGSAGGRLSCSVVPCRPGGRGYVTHGSLRKGSDGKAGIDAEVGRYDGSITDVHVRVPKDSVPGVDHAVLRGVGDDASPDAVCRAWNIENDFRKHAHGASAGNLSELFCKLVRQRNVSRNLVASAHQSLAKGPEPRALPAHFDVAIECLHAKQDHRFACPAQRLSPAQGPDGVAQQSAADILQPKRDSPRPRAAVGQTSGKKTH